MSVVATWPTTGHVPRVARVRSRPATPWRDVRCLPTLKAPRAPMATHAPPARRVSAASVPAALRTPATMERFARWTRARQAWDAPTCR
jgi:hypothetical protein